MVGGEVPDACERSLGARGVSRLVGAIDRVDQGADFLLGDGNSSH
jgi:hypothetical protein